MQTTRKPEFGSSISSRILNKERTFTEDITVTVPENIEETGFKKNPDETVFRYIERYLSKKRSKD